MASKYVVGAFVQTHPKFGHNELNIEEAIKVASKVRADIYVFPELSNTGYAFTSKRECHSLAESFKHSQSIEAFQSFSERNNCTMVAGLAEKDGGRTYNSSVVIERGLLLGTYRKMHLFFREKLWFSKSESGFKPFKVNSLGLNIGVLICFDWCFPEACRTLALQGAEVICHPSNLVLPGNAQATMSVRALENRVFTITANRTGSEDRGPRDSFRFTGNSQIISPKMVKLASATATEVTAKTAKLDLNFARDKLITSMNDVFKDRRVGFY
ncbi:MAG: acyltransferase [Nitrososphaerota archaeon]|nr:acyltransferase [Nitrososphaerota archaeon]